MIANATNLEEETLKTFWIALGLMGAASAHSAPLLPTVGPANCKIHKPSPSADQVKWTGPCAEGYAHGPGKLGWVLRELSGEFEGTMQRGLPHGEGYMRMPGGIQYEGTFQNGIPEGRGIYLYLDKSRYEGQVQDGVEHGHGSVTYSTGGRYDGEWRSGLPHGRGKAVYAGGRVVDGQFVNGVPEGTAPAVAGEVKRFSMSDAPPTGSHINRKMAYGSLVPFGKSYTAMTSDEQLAVRSSYGLLHPDDEPPYPMNGTRPLHEQMSMGHGQLRAEGFLLLNVLVGSDGAAKSVDVIAAPNPDIAKFASFVVLKEKYKPAKCSGQPCPMIYPFAVEFKLEP